MPEKAAQDKSSSEKSGEKLKDKIPPARVAGQVLGTCCVTGILSFLGKEGTLVGLVGGSALSSVLPTDWEHWISHGSSAVRARYKELRLAQAPPEEAWKQAKREERRRAFHSLHWKVLGASFLTVLAATTGAIAVAEAAAGKPVSDIVRNHSGSGSTFTGGHEDPSPSPVTPTPHMRRKKIRSSSPSTYISESTPPATSPLPGATSPTPPASSPVVSPSPDSSTPVSVSTPPPTGTPSVSGVTTP